MMMMMMMILHKHLCTS